MRHKFVDNKKLRCVYILYYARENYVVVIFIFSFISVGLILLVLGSNWYILATYAFCLLAFGFYYRRRIYSRNQLQQKGKLYELQINKNDSGYLLCCSYTKYLNINLALMYLLLLNPRFIQHLFG